MKKSRLLGAVCACLTFLSGTASATLVEADLFTAGDGLLTRDTVSGLEWLDLSETLNRSYNSIKNELNTSGEFEGWTYANRAQMQELFNNAGGGNSLDAVNLLLSLWGTTSSTDRHEQSFILADPRNEPWPIGDVMSVYRVRNDKYLGAGSMGYVVYVTDMNFSDPTYGHALIRTSTVPIPPALWLFGSGLLGLVGIARRRS